MAWVRLDDRFAFHPKLMRASSAAFRLHVAALCVCAQNATDGLLDDVALRLALAALPVGSELGTLSAELVRLGLWEDGPEPGTFSIHDYLEYQPSAADQKKERAAAAERMRGVRQRSRERSGERAPEPNAERLPERSGEVRLPRPVPSYKETPDPTQGEEAPPVRAKQAACPPEPVPVPGLKSQFEESKAVLEQLNAEAGGKLRLGWNGEWPALPEELQRFHALLLRHRPPPELLRQMGAELKAGKAFWQSRSSISLRELYARDGELWIELMQKAGGARSSPALTSTTDDDIDAIARRGKERFACPST